jgi:DNA mismatch repair protein MSH3
MKRQAHISKYFEKKSKMTREVATSSAQTSDLLSKLSTHNTYNVGRKSLLASSSLDDWTPLEQQFRDIKSDYPDILLMMECGYRYRFFGGDAEIAARELGIVMHFNHHLWTASIPTCRLSVHLHRLVQAGHKVGLVKQMETAALKAISEQKQGPFRRQLIQIYTKSTLVDELSQEQPLETMHSNILMAIRETVLKSGSDDRIRCSVAAIQLSTGVLYADCFDDGILRSELETRLAFLQPVELLVDRRMSFLTQQALKAWQDSRDTVVRLEEIDLILTREDMVQALSEFYQASTNTAMSWNDELIDVLYMLFQYLQPLHMERILTMSPEIQLLTLSTHMRLTGPTLSALEVVEHQTTFKKEGSLLGIIDHCMTLFGKRLLRRWMVSPLTDIK